MAEQRGAITGARLDHTGLVVPDLDEAVEFFQVAFGAEVVFRMYRFDDPTGGATRRLGAQHGTSFALAMLGWGDRRLELLQWWPPWNEDSHGPEAVGASHVAVEVPDLWTALESLRHIPGVRVVGDPVTFTEGPTPGLTNAFVSSPWGCLIELMQWPGDDLAPPTF